MVAILIAASGILLLGLVVAIYSACVLASRTDKLIRDAYLDSASGKKDSPNPPASGVSRRELLGST